MVSHFWDLGSLIKLADEGPEMEVVILFLMSGAMLLLLLLLLLLFLLRNLPSHE